MIIHFCTQYVYLCWTAGVLYLFFPFLIPVAVIYYEITCKNRKISAKYVSIITIFYLISYYPYVFGMLYAGGIYGWWSMLHFCTAWTLFFISHYILTGRYSIILPIFFGLVLTIYPTTYVHLFDGKLYFSTFREILDDFKLDTLAGFFDFLEFSAFFVLPLIGVHRLMNQNKY
jgi:hypothetical protein